MKLGTVVTHKLNQAGAHFGRVRGGWDDSRKSALVLSTSSVEFEVSLREVSGEFIDLFSS